MNIVTVGSKNNNSAVMVVVVLDIPDTFAQETKGLHGGDRSSSRRWSIRATGGCRFFLQ